MPQLKENSNLPIFYKELIAVKRKERKKITVNNDTLQNSKFSPTSFYKPVSLIWSFTSFKDGGSEV